MTTLWSTVVVIWTIEYSIIKLTTANTCQDGDARLRGGRYPQEGVVEICRNQQWGRVCDDYWDKNDSTVVCRQLGFSEQGAQALASTYGIVQFAPNSTDSTPPFLLDDLGCSGSERNLLDCLPQHNCLTHYHDENAGVKCLRQGVNLEYGSNQERNNTLIILDTNISGNQEMLICSTDREDSCSNELIRVGGWFQPSGSKVESPNVTFGNQTLGLSLMFGREMPGIYHCELMDVKNVTHYLYVGIYPENEGFITDVSVEYDSTSQILTCTSTGGPATHVTWSRDNVTINTASNGGVYEHSQVIINTTSGTYENRLRIIEKSSKTAGTYRCELRNLMGSTRESLKIQVCRDAEVRVNWDTSSRRRLIEVCIDDHWYEAISSTTLAYNSQSVRNASTLIQVDSTSVMTIWSVLENIPNNRVISEYDLSCKTSSLSDGHIKEVKISNISANTTKVLVDGLLPGVTYNCCLNAHIGTNTTFYLIRSDCFSAKTKVSSSDDLHIRLWVGFGAGLGVCCLLLVVVCIVLIFVIIHQVIYLKKRSAKKQDSTNEATEEYNLVVNPTYNIVCMQRTARQSSHDQQQENIRSNTTTTTGEGTCTTTAATYEEVYNYMR